MASGTQREFGSGLLLPDGILYSLGKYLPLLSDLGQAPDFLRALPVKSFCKFRLPTPRATCCHSDTGGIQLEFAHANCNKMLEEYKKKRKPTGNLFTIFDPAIHQLAITEEFQWNHLSSTSFSYALLFSMVQFFLASSSRLLPEKPELWSEIVAGRTHLM